MRFAPIRYEASIAASSIRALGRRVSDCLTLLSAIPVFVLVARAKIAELPDDTRWLVGYGITWLFAMLLAKALIQRWGFHRTDGVLACQSQHTKEAIAYLFPLTLVGLAAGISAIAILGLFDPGAAMLGMSSGLPTGALLPWVDEYVRRVWHRVASGGIRLNIHARASLGTAAGVSGAVGGTSVLLPSDHHIDALVTGVYFLIVLLLTASVDARVVRYMTLMGRSTWALLGNWLPLQIVLLSPVTMVLLTGQAWVPASLAAITLLALPVVTAMRIFAYRAFGRLIADWSVALILAAAMYAGFTLPPLGPVILMAGMLWLLRRGAGHRWLLT